MPTAELKSLIRKELSDHHAHRISDVVSRALKANTNLYESEVKSTLLGMVRRNEVDLTDQSKVQLLKRTSL